MSSELLRQQWRTIRALESAQRSARKQVRRDFRQFRAEQLQLRLERLPLSRLQGMTPSPLPLHVLAEAGLNVAQIADMDPRDLVKLRGVGAVTAKQSHSAAVQLRRELQREPKVRIDIDPSNPNATRLVRSLQRLVLLESVEPPWGFTWAKYRVAVRRRVRLWSRWLFDSPLSHDADVPAEERSAVVFAQYDFLERANATLELGPATEAQAWEHFSRNSIRYYLALDRAAKLPRHTALAGAQLPKKLVKGVTELVLDESRLKVELRNYQRFGAQYMVAQRHTLLGDEMGLGKTIQAIAALAHVHATEEHRHSLVVAPASLVTNWVHEIQRHSDLPVRRLFGEADERDDALEEWREHGGIAVTTLDQVRIVTELPEAVQPRLGMVIVDEAHLIKNPETKRTKRILSLLPLAQRVSYLTGTPLENRLAEFVELIGQLQPELAAQIPASARAIGAEAFQRAVASVYLRRLQLEVLPEIPELTAQEEWGGFTAAERLHYLHAVRDRHFMRMRQAAFTNSEPLPTKVERILEICDQAAENGEKVLIFSYFHATIERVSAALQHPIFGPITGATPTSQRQQIVDEFTEAQGSAVLVAQIQAAGMGLNLQTANVVIICEPQVKPSMERQAVARARRMGQTRTVRVHRLLTEHTVDERLHEHMAAKQDLFDDYVNESYMAQELDPSVERPPRGIGGQIVEEETQFWAQQLSTLVEPGRGGTDRAESER